ncbi:antiviral RADAR system adenosine triphosphatase RdrA [Shewanella baltica]|uniref:antiviral RADAR system adenosine triphosphatase RdrA n=1 Tax=Shewanella baltica TaxID=62322 RepID=UPI003D78CEB5
MPQGVTLNLEKNEYLDVYTDGKSETSDLWQLEAKDKLISLLSTTLKEAESYKKIFKDDSSKIYAAHNSICISGSRGAGKTVFLRSAEKIWHSNNEDNEKSPALFFLDIIDPTLLDGHDRFANVLIAQLYNAVEIKLESSNIPQEKKNYFYSALKLLAESLGKASEFDDCTGIDRILRYRSGVQIERLFHNYVYQCIELLNCSAIVISIDDVDMALNRAFEVLDDIRRLLSCPFLIPLVSGDHKLYSHMAKVHFEQLATDQRISESTMIAGHKSSEDLADAYLTKVFPNHLRLPLLPIERLLVNFEIKESSTSKITYEKYVSDLKMRLYPLCNGQERSTNWPEPSSAREVSQLVRAIKPCELSNNDSKSNLESRFQTWAEQKQDGFAYTNCNSFMQLNVSNPQFCINDLISFNPILQIKANFDWASKNFYDEQLERLRELFPTTNKGDSNLYIKNSEIFKSVYKKGDRTLRSMPALEFFKNEIRINKGVVNSDPNNLLIALYTHHDYYNGQGNRTYHVFFSRAFEILTLSILVGVENDTNINWENKLSSVLRRPPFYSIFAVNPTKMLDEETDGDEDSPETDTDFTNSIKALASSIEKWLDTHNSVFSSLNGINLFPLLSAVFNKVFTQLHILRRNMKGEDEHLSDIARRFEYIFINAFATFTRSGEVVNANTALTAKPQTIRDHGMYFNTEKTFSRNLKNFISKEGIYIEESTEQNRIAGQLIEAIWSHPVFVANSSRKTEKLNKLFMLSSTSSKTEENNIEEIFNSVKSSILKSSNNTRLSIDLINDWIKNESEESKLIYDKVMMLMANDDPHLKKLLESKRKESSRFINYLIASYNEDKKITEDSTVIEDNATTEENAATEDNTAAEDDGSTVDSTNISNGNE